VVELIIPSAIYDEIIAHTREGAPEEVCGILSGKDRLATAIYRARNVAADRLMDYVVDDRTLLLQFEFEERGERLLAIYHSHPDSPAFPSATDAWRAFYPEAAYIICSLAQPRRPVVRAFYLVQAPSCSLAKEEVPADATPLRGDPSLRARYMGDRHSGRYDFYEISPEGEVKWTSCQVREVPILIV